MKKLLIIVAVIALVFSFSVYAANGNITYNGKAHEFIFEPGSEYSPTDLFPNFKGVMPGDTLTQKITVKNDADKNIKVMIYLRAVGAHEDSVEFLSQLGLKVQKSSDNEMAYMFDAAANETAQLTDWVCLGTFYSGAQVDLDVTLNVPVELDSKFQNEIGYLDWEFSVVEILISPDAPELPGEDDTHPDTDGTRPDTSDNFMIGLCVTLIICSIVAIIILLVWRKKNKENKENVEKH